ncbi:MAG: LamG domain-containing protein, partial [Chitinophagaceae bacterium]|nr:LamG domain-containing protein [Chitinophagaceae bacterium]
KFADVTGMVLGNFAFETDPTLASHGGEDWARGINGSLDQFRIYKVALSAAEITNLFTGKL